MTSKFFHERVDVCIFRRTATKNETKNQQKFLPVDNFFPTVCITFLSSDDFFTDLEVSEAENKRLKSELEQLKCGYERDMEVLKKKNDSLLEESERHMEVG